MFKKPIILVLIALSLAGLACGLVSRTEREAKPEGISGRQVFQRSGCIGCHDGVVSIAPSLDGLYGEEVLLESGETLVADEEYLRESILNPNAKVVQGYQPVMPEFEDQLSEDEVEALVEYIVSLRE